MSAQLWPDGDPWLFDVLVCVLDGDVDRASARVLAQTGNDPEVLGELVGALLRMIVELSLAAAGGNVDVVRQRLREIGVLHTLTGLDAKTS